MTDFNDLALENEQLAKHQLEEAMWQARQRDGEQTGKVEKGVFRLDSWAGRREIACEILKETPHRFLVRLGEDCLLPGGRQATKGQEVYVPKDAISREIPQSWVQELLAEAKAELGSNANQQAIRERAEAMLRESHADEYEIVQSGRSEEMPSELSARHQREWQNFENQAQAAVEQEIHL